MAEKKQRRKAPGRIVAILIALVAVFLGKELVPVEGTSGPAGAVDSSPIAELFREKRSDVMVSVSGTVERTLPDDREGSRHQRFIVRLPDDLTVLVAHNIDLAPRVPLDEGDAVEIRGQYEYNEQGGVLHWTHHDPQGQHDEGWIRHDGQLYE